MAWSTGTAAEQIQSYAGRVGARVVVVDAVGRTRSSTRTPRSLASREFASRPEVAAALDGGSPPVPAARDTLGTDLV